MTQPESFDYSKLLKNSQSLECLKPFSQKKMGVLSGKTYRPLSEDEIAVLESQGNHAENWQKILVAENFQPRFISESTFIGQCFLGVFTGVKKKVGPSVELPSGIVKSTVIHSELGDDCLVYRTDVLSNIIIREDAVLCRIGALICSEECSFGNGIDIFVGPETGGRSVLSFAELTIPMAETIAAREEDKSIQDAYGKFIQDYIGQCRLPFGVVDRGSVIWNTTKIEDTFIGTNVLIDGASLVKDCTILGTTDEPTEISNGAIVTHTCVQWGCTVTTSAIVDRSVMTEHSRAERLAKVTHSIIGPNTTIAEGEVTSCLVGPFVGFHHQSLLIAAIWPEGRGNVGSGANIGSNHTGKAPDQEIHCGEGTFFGLGVNIKFPSNFTKAPYCIIATGVDTLPQRLEFPFSLINKPSRQFPDFPPAYNEIFPGWVLSDNIYTIKRNEDKFKTRDKARRIHLDFDILRPDIVDMIIHARNLLQQIKTAQKYYTDRHIPGLGKNILTDENRIKGMETYGFYIEYYALKGLMLRVNEITSKKPVKDITDIIGIKTDDLLWEHRKKVLKEEKFHERSMGENFERLIILQEKIEGDTLKDKKKDDVRGNRIIPDYSHAVIPAAQDPLVLAVQEETRRLKKDIQEIFNRIP
jgi:NDP-sugar pyrophosphorylase family protein